MYFLIDLCATVLDCVWLVLALHDTYWPIILVLYDLLSISIVYTTYLPSRMLLVHTFLSLTAPPAPPNPPPPAQTVLFCPSCSLHILANMALLNHLAHLPSRDRATLAPYMRESQFANLAESLLENDPAPILAQYGIKLPPIELHRIDVLKSLPEIVVTPPEDGNRKMVLREEKLKGREARMKKRCLLVPERFGKGGQDEEREGGEDEGGGGGGEAQGGG